MGSEKREADKDKSMMEKSQDLREERKQWYISSFASFEARLNGSRSVPFHQTRKNALACFAELGFPTQRQEEWRYTNIAPLLREKFQLDGGAVEVKAEDVKPFVIEGLKENLMVFVNGRFQPELSRLASDAEGLHIASLRQALMDHSGLVEQHLGKHADFERETFTALNTAFADDGLFVFVPDNTVVAEPLHVVNLAIADGTGARIAHPRNLFVVGKNSQVSIVEGFHYLGDGVYFNNLVTEVVVAERAVVNHLKVQEESHRAYHVSNTKVHQRQGSVYTSVNVDLGAALARNNLNILLDGENCEANMFGFYLGQGRQHIDNHTFIDHAKPHCDSNELYKGILDQQARAVFSGKILVRPDAQKTNAFQSNKTLLLTSEANINAKPQLEIFADDVKCSHGATIGQLDDEAMFYLRSRGIGEHMAGAMLRHAFISDVLGHIGIEPLREALDHKIMQRFAHASF
ncbi:MAG: Fe-S cluster assembly protein SufD [Calditrichaeota bacterium]|nr:MAG: Fe-S cluster assembly protein SufD [Calditrichota bacterium]